MPKSSCSWKREDKGRAKTRKDIYDAIPSYSEITFSLLNDRLPYL